MSKKATTLLLRLKRLRWSGTYNTPNPFCKITKVKLPIYYLYPGTNGVESYRALSRMRHFLRDYLAIILRGRVGYEMIDSQRGA